jgi:hypothetical protein
MVLNPLMANSLEDLIRQVGLGERVGRQGAVSPGVVAGTAHTADPAEIGDRKLGSVVVDEPVADHRPVCRGPFADSVVFRFGTVLCSVGVGVLPTGSDHTIATEFALSLLHAAGRAFSDSVVRPNV